MNSSPSCRTTFRRAALALAFAAAVLPLRTAHADPIGNIISYQGKATDTNGAAVTGEQTIVFTIYKDADYANAVVTRTLQVTPVGGVFNVLLNIGATEFAPNADYDIGIKVGNAAEVRHPISATPVAISARGLQGTPVSSTKPEDGQALRFNGATGKWEPASGAIGPQGLKGDTGEQGLKGDTGEQGLKGDTGLTGDQGLKGDTGDQGLKGDIGDQGPRGFEGPPGQQGFDGQQGEQGPQGEQGWQGWQGQPGPEGAPGQQGPKGDTGAAGNNGLAFIDPATLSGDGNTAQTPLAVRQNYVTLTGDQTIGGVKTFNETIQGNISNAITANSAITAGSATDFTGNLAGDVSGTQNTTRVAALQGRPISAAAAAPAPGQVLVYNGQSGEWEPKTLVVAQSVGTANTFGFNANAPRRITSDGTSIWAGNGDFSLSKVGKNGVYIGNFPITYYPDALCSDGANIWAVEYGRSKAVKVRASDGVQLGTVDVGSGPFDIVSDGTNVWTANYNASSITRINIATGARTDFPAGINPTDICFDGANLWLADGGGPGSVTKVNAATGAVIDTYPASPDIADICFDGTSIWTLNFDSTVTKINVVDGSNTGFNLGAGGVSAIISDTKHIYVSDEFSDTVIKLDLNGTRVTDFDTGDRPGDICFDGTNVWTVNVNDTTLTRLSPGGTVVSFQ